MQQQIFHANNTGSAGVARSALISNVGVSINKILIFLPHIQFLGLGAHFFGGQFVISRTWLRLMPVCSIHCLPEAKGGLRFS